MEEKDILRNMEKMNKSTTNRDSADDPTASIVSRATLGQRVLVNGHFGGVLRYLGTVAGKEGLYCGVELDQRVGKNDGTYGGVAYFDCPFGYGVFAPTHKVQPELYAHGSRPTPIMAHRHQKLQKNACNGKRMASSMALPSSSGSSTVTPPPTSLSMCPSSAAPARHPPVPPLPPMDWSLMSLGSTNSDGSAATAGHFNIFDDSLMANSQVTYTVFDSDCLMLSDLELSDSTVLRLDEDESERGEEEEEEEDNLFHQQKGMFMLMEEEKEETKRTVGGGSLLDRSVILEGPTLNLALPVIESNKMEPDEENEEETPTPMVEMRRTDDFRRERDEDRLNRNHLRLELAETAKSQRISAQQQNANNNNSTSGVGKGRTPTADGTLGLSVSQKELLNNNNNRNGPQWGQWEEERRRGQETLQQRKETPKRPRATLFQSTPAANPMRNKCKAPSKSQMIMDQLKASIEAEKQRSKKKKEEEEKKKREEEEERKIREEEEERKKREEEEERKKREEEEERKKRQQEKEPKKRKIEEMNELNEKLPTEGATNSVNMEPTVPKVKEVKSRRSMLAKSSQQRPPIPHVSAQSSANAPSAPQRGNSRARLTPTARPVLSSRENTSVALKGTLPIPSMTRNRSIATKSQSVEHVAVAQKHLSGIVRNTANGRAKESKSANSSDRQRKEVEEELDRTKQRLKHTTKTLDVFSVVAAHFDRKLDAANSKTTFLIAQKGEETAQHERAIAELDCNWKKRLQRADEEHWVEIEKLRADIYAERLENVAKIERQHQKYLDESNERAQELEKKLEEEKHLRELAESKNQTSNRLHQELESLNYELEVKNEELSKLREKNRELQFEVDELRGKEAKKEDLIAKLKSQNGDLRAERDRLIQQRKTLDGKYERCKQRLEEALATADAATKKKEELEYKLDEQNGEEANSGQQNSTPRTKRSFAMRSVNDDNTPLNNRTPETQRKRATNLSMSCHHSNGKALTPGFDMSRSMDSSLAGQSLVACYMQEGRSKPQNTPTKIYTPREVMEIPPDSSVNGGRVVNFDSMRENEESKKDCGE